MLLLPLEAMEIRSTGRTSQIKDNWAQLFCSYDGTPCARMPLNWCASWSGVTHRHSTTHRDTQTQYYLTERIISE